MWEIVQTLSTTNIFDVFYPELIPHFSDVQNGGPYNVVSSKDAPPGRCKCSNLQCKNKEISWAAIQ